MSKMKGITLCADCAYYSMKKHKCTRGATDESDPLASFYGDCPLDDVAPVVHGRWDEIPNKYMSVTTKTGSYSGHATSCSVCHEINPNAFKTNYCPNCGAKMCGDMQ